jgi:hypothetical protein
MSCLDENFICGSCGGIIQQIDEEDGQAVYQ